MLNYLFNQEQNLNIYSIYCKSIWYISDIHLVHKILDKFNHNNLTPQVVDFIHQIVEGLFTDDLQRAILNGCRIIFLGDISSDFRIAKIFYTDFIDYFHKICKKSFGNSLIYAVLGNHEFWDFDTIDECYSKYQNLFDSLGIQFLNNTITQFENGTIVIGGVGFAGFNQTFNADSGIYRKTLNRIIEQDETVKWNNLYNIALQQSKVQNCILIVITHNPLNDWKQDAIRDTNCIYFNGHSHRNNAYHNDDENIHIFADNQIGYTNTKIQFKEAFISRGVNPFASYTDGYHEIESDDYLKFYRYMQEYIQGNGTVEYQLKNKNSHFYMIKHNGFYGFFLTTLKGTYICAGGRIKKISECNDIRKFNANFSDMVQEYLRILTPYRKLQEKISKAIKSFDGEGRIHGCIIDIDFYNHIMVNPIDGCITYYYSPVFGEIERHKNLISLLSKHNPTLADKYIKQLELKSDENTLQIFQPEESVKIDIKNSIYHLSGEINQLQRLFEKRILRDWNENLLPKPTIEQLQKSKDVTVGISEDEMLSIMGSRYDKTILKNNRIKYEWYIHNYNECVKRVSIYTKNGLVREIKSLNI